MFLHHDDAGMIHPGQCPHFSSCPGCELKADYQTPPLWKEALLFFQRFHLEPELISAGFSQTRLKAKLAVRRVPDHENFQRNLHPDFSVQQSAESEGNLHQVVETERKDGLEKMGQIPKNFRGRVLEPQIGLFKKGTHQVISIPHCLVHHPSINEAVFLLNTAIVQQKIEPYAEDPPRGSLRYVQLSVERQTGRIQLVLVSAKRLDAFCQSLLSSKLWHSIWLNHHPAATNQVFGPSWELLYGEPFLWQTIAGIRIPFHPAAFSQSHLALFEKIVEQIGEWAQPSDRVLELYAGVGAIGLFLSQKVQEVTFVENNPFAYLSFQQCHVPFPYLCMDAKQASLEGYDMILVDPPRKGLAPELLQKLIELPSGRLIYISCGFDSFQRDCEALVAGGWRLKEAKGYLLFPGTNHIEILSLFFKNDHSHLF